MKLYRIFFIGILFLCFQSCEENKPKTHTISSQEEIPSCKMMMIVGDDRSGSSGSIQKLSKEDYAALIDVIKINGHGYFSSTIIGNPAPNAKEIFRVKIKALKEYQNILTSDNPTLTELAKQKKHDEKIKLKNEKIKKSNEKKISSFLTKTIATHIEGYKPYKGKDITNIDLSFEHINKLLKEPNVEDYDKVIVILFTDGVNEPKRSGKIVKITQELNLPDNAELFLIGWKDTSVFSGIEFNEFEGKEGLFSYLEDFDCL